MTQDLAKLAAGLTEPQREALKGVCRTNGGGVHVRCKVNDDGYGIPTNPAMRKLHTLGLIQGKSGDYETVVHTREGLTLYRHHLLAKDSA